MSRWLTVLLLIWLCLLTFPTVAEPLPATLDGSWGFSMNMAHVEGLRFGSQINFTYGPLAYLNVPDAELVPAWQLWLYWMGIFVLFWIAALRCLQLIPSRVSALILIGTLSIAMVYTAGYTERLQLAVLAWGVVLLSNRGMPHLGEYLLVAGLAAWSFLTKTNDGFVAVALYYAAASWEVLTRRTEWPQLWRRWAIIATAPAVLLILLFLVFQGTIVYIPSYFLTALRIAAGYSEGMSSAGPVWQLAAGLIAMAVLFVVIPRVADDAPAWRAAVLPALLISFLFFKHGFIRQDSHADIFHLRLATVSTLLLCLANTWRDRRLLNWFAITNVAMGVAVIQGTAPHVLEKWNGQITSPSMLVEKLHDMAFFGQTYQRLREGQRTILAGLVLPPELRAPVAGETADSFPHDIDYVRANHWYYQPRPIIQSYTAYSPPLDQMNAEHLAGPNAPAFMLMRWDAIDGQHPFFDDDASWRALVNYYDIAVKSSTEYLLTRRRGPRFTELKTIGKINAPLDEEIRVPRVGPEEFLVMRAKLDRTLLGTVQAALFRLDPIYLHATYASGLALRYRVVRPNLIDGALITYLPHELKRVAPYFGEIPSGLADQVQAIQFETPTPRQYARTVEIEWQVMSLRPHEADPAAIVQRPKLPWTPLWQPGDPGFTAVNTAWSNVGGSMILRPETLDPQMMLQLKGDLSTYKTLMIRARYSVADLVNVFFSKMIDGRAFDGTVPVAEQWLDCYVNTTVNPYWKTEAGTLLRFDPSTNRSRGAVIEVKGIWGSTESPFTGSQQMAFYPADQQDPAPLAAPTPGSSR